MGLQQQLTAFAIHRPRTIYLLVSVLVVLTAAMIPAIQIDTDPENMLPADHLARLFHQQVKRDFSMHDSIVVGAVASHQNQAGIFSPGSLADLHHLTEQILTIEGVVNSDLLALSTADNISQSAPGTVRFEYLMKEPPKTLTQAQAIGQAVARLPLLNNTLVSADGQAAAIYVPLYDKDDSYRIAEQIRAVIATLDTANDYYITGLPVAENQFGHEMFVQMAISAPLAGAMIFLLMWLFFRSIALVTGPMLVAMATVIATMGALIGMGYTVHIMSSMIAIFLMPIAVVDSIHIMSDFTDRYRAGDDVKALVQEVMTDLFRPMLLTSITSAAGFYSLLLTPIPPVQVFGVFVGSGILLAFVISVLLIPAYIVRTSAQTLNNMQAKLSAAQTKRGWLVTLLPRLGDVALARDKALLIVACGLLAFSLWGISKIQINDNPVRWFKSDHEIRVADKQLNAHFAGTYDAWLVLRDSRPLVNEQQQAQLERLLTQLGITLPSSALDDQALTSLLTQLDDLAFNATSDSQQQLIDQAIVEIEQLAEQSRSFLQPAALKWIDDLQTHLQTPQPQSLPLVGKANTLADIVKTVNRELRSGQADDFALPDTAAGVAQALLQFQSSHRPDDLWHFVSRDYRQSLIWLQLTSGDNQHMNRVIEQLEEYIASHPLPAGMEMHWAGKAYINVIWQDAMVSGMATSLASAFVIVFIMMVLLFRSLVYGLIAMLPLTLTIAFIYGLAGWLGKDYDMPIAVLSALALGLSVDFAIHFIERARALLTQTGSARQTFAMMFEEPARAISRNAIVIAFGFTPLLLAPLLPYVTVGVLMASIMAISAAATLVLLPAALKQVHDWRQND